MQVSDKFSAYFSTVKLDPTLSSKQEIEKHIKESSQCFSYGSVNYPAYEGKYTPKGYIQRKIVAIPAALWAGIVKSIYHLAKVVFYGIPKACIGESRHIKADVYRIARDMEEALGWLVTLFNDKRGSYLIQESLFQKECYNYFEEVQKKVSSSHSSRSNNNYPFSFSRTFINGVEIPHCEEARKITLRNFREMNSEARQEAIKKFQLQSNIEAIGQEQFFQKLNEANEQALELVNLVDLKMDVKTSKMKYALLSDNEFKKVTIGQLEDASPEQMRFIFQRIEEVKDAIPDEKFNENLFELPVAQLHRVPGQKLSEVIDKIPESIFTLITDNQLKQLNLTNVNENQINKLFCYIDGKEEKRRFALLSIRQVQDILGKLGEYQLKLISDNQLNKLDLKDVPADRLQKLFCYIDGKEEKRRFASLPSAQVQVILEKLGEYQLKLISDDHLKELDLSGLSPEKLQKLFCYIDGKEEKRRFACVPVDQVQVVLGKLGEYQLGLISDEQFKKLNLSSLSMEKINLLFPTFSKESIRLEHKGKHYSFSSTYKNGKLTVNEQVGISEKEVERISAERKRINSAKLALLSSTQIMHIRDKLTQENLELITI
jgi:hypothetical protein